MVNANRAYSLHVRGRPKRLPVLLTHKSADFSGGDSEAAHVPNGWYGENVPKSTLDDLRSKGSDVKKLPESSREKEQSRLDRVEALMDRAGAELPISLLTRAHTPKSAGGSMIEKTLPLPAFRPAMQDLTTAAQAKEYSLPPENAPLVNGEGVDITSLRAASSTTLEAHILPPFSAHIGRFSFLRIWGASVWRGLIFTMIALVCWAGFNIYNVREDIGRSTGFLGERLRAMGLVDGSCSSLRLMEVSKTNMYTQSGGAALRVRGSVRNDSSFPMNLPPLWVSQADAMENISESTSFVLPKSQIKPGASLPFQLVVPVEKASRSLNLSFCPNS